MARSYKSRRTGEQVRVVTKRNGSVVGNKRMVWNRTADITRGGLRRQDLMLNKWGRIVSKKKHQQGKAAMKANKSMMATPFGKNN